MEGSQPVGQISVEEFTEATFTSVMRAFEASKEFRSANENVLNPGPIIFGIIFWPEGGPGPGTGPTIPVDPPRE